MCPPQVGLAAAVVLIVGVTILAMDTVELEFEVPQIKPVTQKQVRLCHPLQHTAEYELVCK